MGERECLGWIGNVQIIVSMVPPSYTFMKRIIGGLAELSDELRAGTGAMLVIESSVDPPDDKSRAYIRAELARSSMLAAAQVVEGTGFRGAAMRAVLSMLQIAVRPSYSMKIFSEVSDGALWLSSALADKAGVAPSASEIAFAVADMKQRMEAPSGVHPT
jgi:hypothetical protein